MCLQFDTLPGWSRQNALPAQNFGVENGLPRVVVNSFSARTWLFADDFSMAILATARVVTALPEVAVRSAFAETIRSNK